MPKFHEQDMLHGKQPVAGEIVEEEVLGDVSLSEHNGSHRRTFVAVCALAKNQPSSMERTNQSMILQTLLVSVCFDLCATKATALL